MSEFPSLGAFAEHLLMSVVAETKALERGLDRVLILIEKRAQAEFGTYQSAVGPHPGWPELSDRTKDERVKQGFTENDPLLRSGELRAAVTRSRYQLEGLVGVKGGEAHSAYPGKSATPDLGDLMIWMEFGTEHVPARPVLGPAAFVSKPDISRLVGAAAVNGLLGQDLVHEALGYNFGTLQMTA